MAECGVRVGKGLVTYPCELDAGHEGPHYARENDLSKRQRKQWEKDQAEAIMVPIQEITEEVREATDKVKAIISRNTHPASSDTLQEARQTLQEAAKEIERLIEARDALTSLLDEVEAGLPEDAVQARSAASMLRAMLRA